jgi:hypothetical protein
VGIHDLRLSEVLFWRLPPRKLHALSLRHEQARVHLEWVGGIIASTVANNAFGGRKTAAIPSDYMPSVRVKQAGSSSPALTSEQQLGVLRTTFRALAGAGRKVTVDAE